MTEADTARAILEHLRLPSTAPPIAPARAPPQAQFGEWDRRAAGGGALD